MRRRRGGESGLSDLTDATYRQAAGVTGKTVRELQRMATLVFASILYHSLKSPGHHVWTVSRVMGPELELEVDALPPLGKEAGHA
jgi:hypothetical protein